MANKTLTANVKLNARQFETKLQQIARGIDAINKAVGRQSNAFTSVNTALNQSVPKIKTAKTYTDQLAQSANQTANNFSKSNSILGGLTSKLKTLVGAYAGAKVLKLGIDTSDMITSTENKLNTLPGATEELTAETMDKVYAAAQRSRGNFGNMASNVAKTMVLAPDAFQGNVDNAIRFQEIMSKAYTVGGATASEMHNSMTQLTQALGAGILAGDELRSVREGAPLAYKAMEKYVQGVFNTEESLKDLAAQGVVTSDIIVAAMMDAEKEINEKFKKTKMTFGQAWDQIKNMAVQAFRPALDALNKMLNSEAGKKTIEGIGNALVVLGNILTWVINGFTSFFNWCADNWEWLKYVVGTVLGVIIALLIKQAAIAIWNAMVNLWSFITQYWGLMLIVAGIMAILYIYELWRQGTIATTEAIVYCLLVIAAVALIAGIILMSIPLLILAVVIGVIALIIAYFAEFCGAINVGIQAIVNAWFWMCNLAIGVWNWICAVAGNAIKGIANFAIALGKSIDAICTNIGVAFSNAWIWAKNTFWEFLASVLDGVSKLEPVINGIANLLGLEGVDFGALSASIRNKKEEYREYVSVGDAWDSGMNTYQYKDPTEEFNKGWNTYDAFEDGWANNAYNQGYNWGQGVENAVNEWGSQFQDPSNGGLFDDLGNMLGVNGSLPDPNDPSLGVTGAYDPSGADADIKKGLDKLGNIEEDTDDINSKDDMDYLRKIAEMEWRNEFTTAEIKVDMSNYNTVNSDRDLDGIVEYLSDRLKTEMANVAYGVHY